MIILLLANIPLGLLLFLVLALVVLYGWQRRQLLQRCDWRLRCDHGQWYLHRADADMTPVICAVNYQSPWLVVLTLTGNNVSTVIPLFRDGMGGESWRQLHVLARAVNLRDD